MPAAPAVGSFIAEAAATCASTVLVGIHSRECPGCAEFVRSLDAIRDEFAAWDSRLQVLPSGGANVVAADRFGQVFYSVDAGAAHQFPSPRELTEWLKHLGTLCPE